MFALAVVVVGVGGDVSGVGGDSDVGAVINSDYGDVGAVVGVDNVGAVAVGVGVVGIAGVGVSVVVGVVAVLTKARSFHPKTSFATYLAPQSMRNSGSKYPETNVDAIGKRYMYSWIKISEAYRCWLHLLNKPTDHNGLISNPASRRCRASCCC